MIVLYDITIGPCLSRNDPAFGRPSSQPRPSPSDLLALCFRCALAATCNRPCYVMRCVCVCVCGPAWLAGGMSMQILLPLFLVLGFSNLHLLDGSAELYVSNIRLGSSFCKGQGIDGRALNKAPFPFISTRYSARCHLVDGISPPHNLERATSFPRVARGSSSRLRHARILNE